MREAFATGYAEHGVIPVPAWVRAACEAAVTIPDTDAVTRAGRIEGRRAGLERRRQRLYAAHRASVLTHAATLAAAVNIADLQQATGTDDHKAAKAAALAVLYQTLLHTDGLTFSWHHANATAYTDATAEGQAQAAATPTTGGPALPSAVHPVTPLVAATAWQHGRVWTDQQLDGLAGDLARAKGDGLVIRQVLHDAAGVSFYLEDQMHAAAVAGFSVMVDARDATLAFVTMGDGRVCAVCDSYAAGSPYAPGDFPQPPVHGACRCWPEQYAPVLIAA